MESAIHLLDDNNIFNDILENQDPIITNDDDLIKLYKYNPKDITIDDLRKYFSNIDERINRIKELKTNDIIESILYRYIGLGGYFNNFNLDIITDIYKINEKFKEQFVSKKLEYYKKCIDSFATKNKL